MTYGRAGFAQGLAQGLGNISAMLREKRLMSEEEKRRQEDLARRQTERQEDIAVRDRWRGEDVARENVDRRRIVEMQARPALLEQGGDVGPVPREPAGQIRPTVFPEPGPRPAGQNPQRSLAGTRLEGLSHLPEPLSPQGAPEIPQPPVRESVRLPEPGAPTSRGAPLTLTRGMTETFEPVGLPAGGQGYRMRPEAIEQRQQAERERMVDVFGSMPHTSPYAEQYADIYAGRESAPPVSLIAPPEPETLRNVPGRLTEDQAVEQVFKAHPEYVKYTVENGKQYAAGYTVPFSQILRMAQDYQAGRTPKEDVKPQRPMPAGMETPHEAAQARLQAGGSAETAQRAAGAAGVQAAAEATQLQVARQRRQEIKQEHPGWTEAQVKEQMQKEGLVR